MQKKLKYQFLESLRAQFGLLTSEMLRVIKMILNAHGHINSCVLTSYLDSCPQILRYY